MRLVIFDIDGTLIRALRPIDNLQRFRFSIQEVFGIDIGAVTKEIWEKGSFNGKSDRHILWQLIKSHNINRDEFLDRIGEIGDKFVEYLESIKDSGPSYEQIPEGKRLVEYVIAANHLSEGVLTGNLGQSAEWKLHISGLPSFSFGVYGHEADAREDLARLLLPKAKAYFGKEFDSKDIVIVGDTVNDVLCARAIGAFSIIVHTGWNVTKKDFDKVPADLHVDSLLDERVLTLLGLKK